MSNELIEAAPVARADDGSFWHPGMPLFDEGQEGEMSAWIAAQGLEIKRGMLEDCPDDHPVYVDYFENGASSFLEWVDEPPSGEGWFTLAIQDSEDGPGWCWARRFAQPKPTKEST